MSTVYTRATKGSALTWTEGDANITNLNNDKMEKSTPVLAGNLDVVTYSITTSTTNGNITIEPNGTGDVHLVTDALRVGDLNTEARISTYGTGDLVLTTNEGNDPDPTITIGNGANADITLTPSGTGIVSVVSDLEVGYGTGTAAITSKGAYDLDIVTNGGTNSGLIRIVDGANGDIELTPNGTGNLVLDGLNWPQTDGTADYVLKTNGSGQLSWVAQPSAGATTLDGLTDVVITAAATNDVLVYNGTNWVDTAANTLTVSAASTATTATTATNVTIVATGSDTTMYPVVVGALSGSQIPYADIDFKWDASANILVAPTVNATNFNGIIGATTPAAGSFTTISASSSIAPNNTGGANINFSTSGLNASAWTTLGIGVRQQARTYTDSSSTGTVAVTTINGFNTPTLASTNAITVTEAANLYVQPPSAGTNTTITTSYGLISTGRIKATDFVGTIGATTTNTGAFTTLSATGTTTLATSLTGLLKAASGVVSAATAGTDYVAVGGALGTPSSGTVTNLTGTASININGTVGATTPAAGTFTSINFKNPIEPVYSLGTTGGTIAPDPANGSVQSITLNSALTMNAFTNPTAGESLTLIINGGTAYTSITSTMKFAGGIKTLTGTAGCVDILSVFYDGTTYYASLGKGFA